jgi:hypothetical protein
MIYNVDSGVYQGVKPVDISTNAIWIMFSGVNDPQFKEFDNYNQDMWVLFDVARIKDESRYGDMIILNLIQGTIAAYPSKLPEYPLLIVIPTQDQVGIVQTTTVMHETDGIYNLIVPTPNLVTIIDVINAPDLNNPLPTSYNNSDSSLSSNKSQGYFVHYHVF